MRAIGLFGRGLLIAAVLLLSFAGGRFLNLLRRDASAAESVSVTPQPVPSRQAAMQENPLLRTNAPPANSPETYADSPDRVADARIRHGEAIAARFSAVGLKYPPREIYIRVFKHEGELEIWARNQIGSANLFRLAATFPIMAASGRLGPKRQEGDLQVPEGFYVIDRFNPRSGFHLSLGLNYPNVADRILATDPAHPGYDVFIHGDCVSVGCMAMGDPAIEEIYLAASDAKLAGQREFPVHIFPCRMTPENWSRLLSPIASSDAALGKFWESLRAGSEYFEQARQLPKVSVSKAGSYVIRP